MSNDLTWPAWLTAREATFCAMLNDLWRIGKRPPHVQTFNDLFPSTPPESDLCRRVFVSIMYSRLTETLSGGQKKVGWIFFPRRKHFHSSLQLKTVQLISNFQPNKFCFVDSSVAIPILFTYEYQSIACCQIYILRMLHPTWCAHRCSRDQREFEAWQMFPFCTVDLWKVTGHCISDFHGLASLDKSLCAVQFGECLYNYWHAREISSAALFLFPLERHYSQSNGWSVWQTTKVRFFCTDAFCQRNGAKVIKNLSATANRVSLIAVGRH